MSTIRALTLVVAFLGSASVAFAASAPGWSASMPAPAVGSYLEGSGLRVIVVAGGTGSGDATAALATSLRSTSSVTLTMPADSLGDVSKLDDAAIIAKAKSMPVDLIAITRVFPGNNGASTAVVTFYRTSGEVASAFTAATNAPLVAKAATTGDSGAASTMVGGVVSGVVSGNQADLEARIKEFQERAVYMQGWSSVDSRSGRVVSTWSVPMQGTYGEALRGPAFYDYIGRPDDAATYRSRQLTRGLVALGGVALLGGGTAYLITGLQRVPNELDGTDQVCGEALGSGSGGLAEFNECRQEIVDANTPVQIVGYSLVGIGGLTLLAPLFISPDPHKTNERERMVDEFNEALMKELGLDTLAARDDRPAIAEVRAGGWASPTGGGLVVAGKF